VGFRISLLQRGFCVFVLLRQAQYSVLWQKKTSKHPISWNITQKKDPFQVIPKGGIWFYDEIVEFVFFSQLVEIQIAF